MIIGVTIKEADFQIILEAAVVVDSEETLIKTLGLGDRNKIQGKCRITGVVMMADREWMVGGLDQKMGRGVVVKGWVVDIIAHPWEAVPNNSK